MTGREEYKRLEGIIVLLLRKRDLNTALEEKGRYYCNYYYYY